jgi:diguanylate cyclase (GGDEF)-like protein
MTYNSLMDKPTARSGRKPLLLYLLLITPWITDYWEKGHWPAAPREMITEISLSILIGAGVSVLLYYRRQMLRRQDEIEQSAQTDALTAVGHPRALEEALVKEVARSRRMDRPLSCIFFDLDDFKTINDRFGHATGNSVLQTVGKSIQGTIRQGMDLAFRYGGDEFVIILPEADKAQAYLIAQRLHQAISALRPPTIPIKSLQASLAVAQLRPEQNRMDLLKLLDKAMHQAKTHGKNLIFDAEDPEKDLLL